MEQNEVALETEDVPRKSGGDNMTMSDTISEPDMEVTIENFSKQKDYATENEGVDVKKKGVRKTFDKVRSSTRVLARPNKFSL